ncbi:MAG: CBS domain-containing protein [Euryarchaeota archaeon]|nr:CBS domain-containing protein [Euryarchaeota archaeon]
MKTKEIMTPNPVSIKADDAATKARSLMRMVNYRGLPVVNDANNLIGVVTRGDLLKITSTRSNIPVRGIMSLPNVTLTPEIDLFDAAKILFESNVNRAFVVKSNTEKELVGVVSSFNIIKAFLKLELKPKKKTAKEIMTTKVVIADAGEPISKVWEKMDEYGHSGLPVVKDGKLIGMITRKDIIEAGCIRIEKESERRGRLKTPPKKIERTMTTPAITVTPNTPVEEIAKIMIERDIGRIPVVERNELVGIVAQMNLLQAFL